MSEALTSAGPVVSELAPKLVTSAPAPGEAPPGRPELAPNRLLALSEGQRPRERAIALGVGALADAELLALILRSGTRGHDVMSLALRLLAEAGSLHALTRWREQDFRRLKGIGRVKAIQLCTVMEITRRIVGAENHLPPELHTPEDIYAFLRPRALGLDVEKCWVISLNTRNRVLRCSELSSGTARQTLVRASEVLREALCDGASAFVIAHNHPSGDPQPSAADTQITRQVRSAADAADLRLHDHVILGEPAADPVGLGYYSFRRGGML
jgi:DNA repair protein RadC